MASSYFLIPLYSQWVPKRISTFLCSQCVPNTHHITIHLYPICGHKCYPPFIYRSGLKAE
jgi:hypothetical protein